ncbi:MAG: hypothetical protein IPJ41_09185 [Phycisphaerales bacterium]|nr:hypothetical protein [Phycisphaerales bacterium]
MNRKAFACISMAAPLALGAAMQTPQAPETIDSLHGSLVVDAVAGGCLIRLVDDGQSRLISPPEGLWSIATAWEDEQPTAWIHGGPTSIQRNGDWLVLSGELQTPEGVWTIRDAYRGAGNGVEGRRRWTWNGEHAARNITLSVRWQTPGPGARVLLPGICYDGNPSGVATGAGVVAAFRGEPGEAAVFEEHRYPMPFACLEWDRPAGGVTGAALHTLPSPTPFGRRPDQWWSLGVLGRAEATELVLLSGPTAINGQWGVVKANQGRVLPYPGASLDVPPGGVIEKTFFLESSGDADRGSAFRTPLRTCIDRWKPFSTDGLPQAREIIRAKAAFAKSRWHESARGSGFRMYPTQDLYVMGWCGQAAAPGFAFLELADRLGEPAWIDRCQKSLDLLATAPVDGGGFPLVYDPAQGSWSGRDPVSQGQAMENFARAILAGREDRRVRTDNWEAFLLRACDAHATRILGEEWRPRSTAEGFLVSPLCKAFAIFGEERFRDAAIKAAEHYASRHLDMTEPYWGGTLDAQCEDKEGAWAAFQAFFAVYEMTGEPGWLERASHAMDVVLTYTCVWDIPLPAGRLADHGFKTRGWTVVSVQNQHLDVYGVLYTPEIYRMGELLGRDDLKRLAIVMYRSCGQMIDPFGSQGEQLQHTNFAQSGDMDRIETMRGGYSEGWTVFWITAHFLNAAADFEQRGIDILSDDPALAPGGS